MSSCFSRCLRVPIAIRAFYESYLWILQTLLLTHPDLHPGLLAHLGLARAYKSSGDFQNSRQAYLDFLTLWKDAEADIPIRKDAEAEYAKLK
ncbi:MAG: hypothetical protein WB762_09600, partial [Candidatus Sulfotelmatobacter sp.]